MKKYLAIISAYWQRAFMYRFTILAYRIGEIAEVVILVTLWSAIFANQPIVGGYTLPQMITYIMVGNIIHSIIRNFLSQVVATDIREGRLSMYLIRPMGYLDFIFAREIGRILLVMLLSVTTNILLALAFSKFMIFNMDPLYLIVIILMVLFAFIFELLFSFLIGIIALWTDDIEGIKSTVDRLNRFLSGGYFPLSLLPPFFVSLSFALPFAYSFFVPAQLYLRKISLQDGLKGLGVQIIWILITMIIIRFVWKKGIRRFEGVGI